MKSKQRRKTEGERLRAVRQRQRLSLRQVEAQSRGIARRLGHVEFVIPYTRLQEIEVRGSVPSIYRLYSLAFIYRLPMQRLLNWYGVPHDKR